MNLVTTDRKYYRLDELANFGVTEGTVRYLIEQDKLQPVFFLPPSHYVLGGYHANKFKGFAIAWYKGLVSIPCSKVVQLLSKGKVTSTEMNLLQREKITVVSSEYPFDVPWPNSYIGSWLKADLAQISWSVIPAKAYPRECDSLMASFVDMLNTINSGSRTAVDDATKLESKIFENHPKRILSAAGQNFNFVDICIQTTDLISIGLFDINQPSNELPDNQESTKTGAFDNQFKNEFEELLARILMAKPQLKAKEIHRFLCVEAEKEEDSRVFDRHNVLMGETNGIISWRDKYRGNVECSYTLDSLRNVISRVRGKLHQ
ncbi:hypothetical protein A5320_16325 [Rheinheimera sp. SA_1]|uniref:hypothetical protein n=1 Tax=Rheinheimera sp. SA_1 TaxID=1827365 RepID=UPI0008016F23|nr:hypothetical protein [Rheinheimera sp. SA_1]OBP14203.1 hypothetical protein A5320_16325 [Rheinheimera sp. SA_1]